jgi:hypothetical protein
MNTRDANKREKCLPREMTVAQIREQQGAEYLEVVFLESARFYRLSKENPRYDEILRRLRAAVAKGSVLKVRCASPDSDIIEEVQAPSSGASEHRR